MTELPKARNKMQALSAKHVSCRHKRRRVINTRPVDLDIRSKHL